MNLLMEANVEVTKERKNKTNEIIAHRMQRKENQYAQKMEEQEEEDRRTAAKMQLEENDSAYAEALLAKEEMEKERKIQQEKENESKSLLFAKKLREEEKKEEQQMSKKLKKQSSKDEKLAKKFQQKENREWKQEQALKERQELKKERQELREKNARLKEEQKNLGLARNLYLKEEKERELASKERQRIAQRDMEMARKLQEEELSDVIDTTDKVVQNWKEPTVEVEEKSSGVMLVVELQGVRRMEVDLDEEEKVVYVTAIPKSKTYDPLHDHHPELRKLACKDKLEESKFHIDLNAIADGFFTHEDIESNYNPKSGELEIFIHNVRLCSMQKRNKFLSKISSNLSKIFRRKSRNKDDEHEKQVGEGLPAAAIRRRYSKK